MHTTITSISLAKTLRNLLSRARVVKLVELVRITSQEDTTFYRIQRDNRQAEMEPILLIPAATTLLELCHRRLRRHFTRIGLW